MSKRPPQSKPGQSIPENMRGKYDAIAALVDQFSRQHLDEEYRTLCLRLATLLARKRPSPLVNGTPAAWACGIVRTIGWVNFLDDKTQQPHMKMTDVDQAFGVSTATGQGRSKAIRDLLKTNRFDPNWTLPSKMAENPIAWIIQVNGLLMDARMLPREIQQEAFERGMIPYIPADAGLERRGERA